MTPEDNQNLRDIIFNNKAVSDLNTLCINLNDVSKFIVKSTPSQKTNSQITVVSNNGKKQNFNYNRENIQDAIKTVLGPVPVIKVGTGASVEDVVNYLATFGLRINANEIEVEFIGPETIAIKTTDESVRYFGEGRYPTLIRYSLSNLSFKYNPETVRYEYSGNVTPSYLDYITVVNRNTGNTLTLILVTEEDGSFFADSMFDRIDTNAILDFTLNDGTKASYQVKPADLLNLPKGFINFNIAILGENEITFNGYAYALSQGFKILLADETEVYNFDLPCDGQNTGTVGTLVPVSMNDTLILRAINPLDNVEDVIITPTSA